MTSATQNPSLHVVPHEEEWALKREGEGAPVETYSTQAEAIEAGREMATSEHGELIIHRADGRIRNVYNYETDAEQEVEAGRNKGSESRLKSASSSATTPAYAGPLAMGSRIRWGAIFGGLVLAISVASLLTALGWAIVSSLEAAAVSATVLVVVWGAWMVITSIVSTFLGGMAVSRLTIGEDDLCEPATYGIILWGLLVVVTPLVLGMASANLGLTALDASQAARPAIPTQVWEEAEFSNQEIVKIERVMLDASTLGGSQRTYLPNEAETAWLTFVALGLSLGAAIFGSIFAAGSERDERVQATD